MHLSYTGQEIGDKWDSITAIINCKKAYDQIRREIFCLMYT